MDLAALAWRAYRGNEMKRDILDYLGNKLGEMELPDDTSEEVWAAKLAKFAVDPPSQQEQISMALSRKVSESRAMADEIIEAFKKRNLQHFMENEVPNDLAIMQSMWVHHRLRAVEVTAGGLDLVIDLLNLVVSGDLETAWAVLGMMAPDEMDQPYHFLSQEVIDYLRGLIADRIGL